MADVQLEHGYTKIANELLDVIQQFQFTQNQYKLLMALWRNTYGWNRKECEFSLSYIESVTYLERKRVNETLKALIEHKVIETIETGSSTKTKIVRFNKHYEQWTIKRYKGSGVMPTSGQDDTSGGVTTSSSGAVTTRGSGHAATHKRKIKNNIKYITADNSAHEELTGGVPTTENAQLSTGSVGQIPGNSSTAYLQVRNRYMALAKIKGFDVSAKDQAYIQELLTHDIDIDQMLRGLEQIFADYHPRHPRDKINSFGYCLPILLDQHIEKLERENGAHDKATVHQYRGRNGRSSAKSKSAEQIYRDIEAARNAWGG